MSEQPKATEKTIVERWADDRVMTVHSANKRLLDFIRAQPFWQYPRMMMPDGNDPTHTRGRVSPLYDFDEVCDYVAALTIADIEPTEDTEATEDDSPIFTGILVDLAFLEDDDDAPDDESEAQS